MTLDYRYSNGTSGQAILDYMISFTDPVDSICPFTISNSSASVSHKTNTAASSQTYIHSGNTETPLHSPKTFLEKTIFSSLASRNSTPSSNSSSLTISCTDLSEYSPIVSSFPHQRSKQSSSGHNHTPNSGTQLIVLLPGGAFHAYHLPQDHLAVLVITVAFSSASHTLFETLNTRSKCGTSLLVIYLSSSARTMEENEQQTLKEQLSVLLAVLFHSEFPRYRAIDCIYTDPVLLTLFSDSDGRRRTVVDPLNFTVYSPQTLPTETRTEGRYHHTHQHTLLSTVAINYDPIFAEYTQPLKPEYLKGRWYAPENIIVIAPLNFPAHISDFILHVSEYYLGKIVGFGVAKGMLVQILHHSSLLLHTEMLFHVLLTL